ncbi:MAG: hypothetical protein ACUVSL_08430 [Chloroflexus sp.]|uniref:hypothetical protein n=1 Tax=Chloroflexus sp. TaxID=1904827 RepID=UPI00404B8199
MNLQEHLITSTLLAVSLYPRQPLAAALVIAGGVLVDLDHLALYISRTGDWSISGALHYNRYRHRFPQPGDSRPRYGSLRSRLHHPLIVLPPLWALAQRLPWVRPLAAGVTLHLLLDHIALPFVWNVYLRAGGRCVRCGSRRKVSVYLRPNGQHQQWQWTVLCQRCAYHTKPLRSRQSVKASVRD